MFLNSKIAYSNPAHINYLRSADSCSSIVVKDATGDWVVGNELLFSQQKVIGYPNMGTNTLVSGTHHIVLYMRKKELRLDISYTNLDNLK